MINLSFFISFLTFLFKIFLTSTGEIPNPGLLKLRFFNFICSPIFRFLPATQLFLKAFKLFFRERNRVDFFPNVLDEIKKLARIYELGCLTNGNADIEIIGIDKFFKFNISSKDVGANKPSENHFHSARELLGLGKDEILHIGDHKVNDMLGAINYGCEALWFNPDKKVWDLKDTKKPFEFSVWKGLTEKINSLYS